MRERVKLLFGLAVDGAIGIARPMPRPCSLKDVGESDPVINQQKEWEIGDWLGLDR